MNKPLPLRCLMALSLLTLLTLSAAATEFTASGLRYVVNDDGISVTVYKILDNMSGPLTIPSSVSDGSKTYTVTIIGKEAFYNCTGITSLSIPSTVTTLLDGAFDTCTGLTGAVTIPNSVTEMGKFVFWNCKNITSVSLGNGLTSIGNSAFYGCSGLTTVSIPNSVVSLGNSVFAYCEKLKTVSIGTSLASVGINLFTICPSLEKITVAQGNATYDSRNNCNAIIEKASNKLVAGCKGTTIPSSVTAIGNYAFRACEITSMTIPASVTSIGEMAFSACNLTSIAIPASVTSIGTSAFAGCSELETITVAAGNTTYDSRDNCNAIIETASGALIAGCKNTVIPSGVTSIANSAFSGSTGLTSVAIPGTVTAIGDNAFSNCNGLVSLTIPASVTSIGASAFSNCTNMTSLTIPASVNTIGRSAFWECSALNDIYCKIRYPNEWNLTCGDNLFYGVPVETCVLHVPKRCAANYREQEQWKNFVNIVEGDIVQNGLFYDVNDGGATVTLIGADNPTDLVIPETITVDGMTYTVTIIDNEAFYRCESLTSVVIPNTVRHLDDGTFENCSSLTKVTIGSGVQAIKGWAFQNCPALMEIHSLNPKPPYCYDDGLVFEIRGDEIDYNHLFDVYDNATLYVPKGCVNAYSNAGDWCLFRNIVEENDADGDLNNDKIVDVSDVSIAIDMVLGKEVPNLINADLDGNGIIDVADVSKIIDIVLGKWTP